MNQPLLFTDKEGMCDSNREIIHRLAAFDNHHRLHNPSCAIGLAHGVAHVQVTGIHPPALGCAGCQPRGALHHTEGMFRRRFKRFGSWASRRIALNG
jgi:hypothetical protein